MRPKERRETGEQDLFRARLDQIIDLEHALVKLAKAIDWRFLEEKFGEAYSDRPGHPPLPTRLMAGLAILKHSYDLSDEGLCERWVENPYFQYFCGEEFFRHRLVFDRSSLTRWRQRMGEERLMALLQESLATATRTGAEQILLANLPSLLRPHRNSLRPSSSSGKNHSLRFEGIPQTGFASKLPPKPQNPANSITEMPAISTSDQYVASSSRTTH